MIAYRRLHPFSIDRSCISRMSNQSQSQDSAFSSIGLAQESATGARAWDPKEVASQTKTLTKLCERISRIFAPQNSVRIVHSDIPSLLETFIKDRVKTGTFFNLSKRSGKLIIDFDLFDSEVLSLCANGNVDFVPHTAEAMWVPRLIAEDLQGERVYQEKEDRKTGAKEKVRMMQVSLSLSLSFGGVIGAITPCWWCLVSCGVVH